jgi:PAS domain S-box-containing protein
MRFARQADWGAALASPKGDLLAVNEAFARIHGWRAEDLVGLPYASLWAAERRDQLPSLFETIDRRGHHRYEAEHVRRDGRTVRVAVAAHAVVDERGELRARAFRVEPVGVTRPAAAFEVPDTGIRIRPALLQEMVDQLPVGIFLTDASGRIVLANPAARRIWGGVRLVGPERYDEYEAWWPDTGERIEPEQWAGTRAIRRGERTLGEVVRIRAFDGKDKTILNSTVPLRDERGVIQGALVVNEDVTHLRETEDALRQAVAAREDVLRIVSHDLRNPLNRIVLHGQVALGELDAAARDGVERHLTKILRAARDMNRLIGDLVDLVHIEQGQLSMEPVPEPAAALVADAVERSRVQAEAASLELRAAARSDLPKVRADRDRVLQVFSNLIGNAIDFTPAGGRIEVAAAVRDREVVFSVTDTGPGIPEQMIRQLFDRFWKGPERRDGGLGLGLAIAQGIVTTHGGRIWADSEPGVGSTFSFTLPIAEPS